MSIEGLTIFGEKINPGFASTRQMFEDENIDAIQKLALDLYEKGALGLNINIGDVAMEKPSFMVDVIRAVQNVAPVPLSFDFPNVAVQEHCLAAYDQDRAKGGKPIINSISECRLEMMSLLDIRPSRVVIMGSERQVDGNMIANETGEEVHDTVLRMTDRILTAQPSMTTDDIIVDVALGPIGADQTGLTRMAINAINSIGSDERLKGVHMIVGLTNLSIMLPKLAIDGSILKPQIESAFLTMTVPNGLDMILGTPGRDYRILDDNNMVMQGFREFLELDGLKAIKRVRKLYKKARRR